MHDSRLRRAGSPKKRPPSRRPRDLNDCARRASSRACAEPLNSGPGRGACAPIRPVNRGVLQAKLFPARSVAGRGVARGERRDRGGRGYYIR